MPCGRLARLCNGTRAAAVKGWFHKRYLALRLRAGSSLVLSRICVSGVVSDSKPEKLYEADTDVKSKLKLVRVMIAIFGANHERLLSMTDLCETFAACPSFLSIASLASVQQ